MNRAALKSTVQNSTRCILAAEEEDAGHPAQQIEQLIITFVFFGIFKLLNRFSHDTAHLMIFTFFIYVFS